MKSQIQLLVAALLFWGSVSANAQWSVVAEPSQFTFGFDIKSYGGDLYAAFGDNIYKSSDDGQSWVNLTNNFINNSGNANSYVEFVGANIFVGTTIAGIFMSPDGGANWQMDTAGTQGGTQVDLLFSDGSKVLASFGWSFTPASYGFYIKEQPDGKWQPVSSSGVGFSYNDQVMGATSLGGMLYAATRAGGVFESPDGITWTKKTNTDYPTPVDMFSFSSSRLVTAGSDLFLGTPNGVYKSSDKAESWTRVDNGFAQWNQFKTVPIMKLYSDGSSVFASGGKDDSVYVSTDFGTSWTDISDNLNHFIMGMTMHNGSLFAIQWDTDTSVVKRSVATDVREIGGSAIPEKFQLSQNYPNPFNPATTIRYSVTEEGTVNLSVYSVLGSKVDELINEFQTAGNYSASFNASKLSSGVYFYRLKANGKSLVRKMILSK